jgi:uncharacterized membrane protein
MSKCAHLWAVGFDDTGQAGLVRDDLIKLAWEKHCLNLLDVAVAVRYPNGTLTLNGEPFPAVRKSRDGIFSRILADLALGAPPLTGASVDALGAPFGATSAEVGIGGDFIQEIAQIIKPGTSVLFVLDEEGNMDAILHAIRGLGGTVLKTNVDLERAKLIQSTLAASGDTNPSSDR